MTIDKEMEGKEGTEMGKNIKGLEISWKWGWHQTQEKETNFRQNNN